MKNFVFSFALLALCSCMSNHEKIGGKLSREASKQGFVQKTYKTETFKIYTLQRITNASKKVRIYFEGDGKALIKKGLLSPNPTPTSATLTDLILTKDRLSNVVYIARPCQYVNDSMCYGNNNPDKYWSTAKFSPEVINAINEVLKNFKQYDLEMVGYSGGANIMKYAAVHSQKNYHNVLNLRSIAGNLDNRKFSKLDSDSSPSDEEFSKGYLSVLAKIPQIHFVGKYDKTVPTSIAQAYLKELPSQKCAKIITIAGASHTAGWQEVWDDLLGITPSCYTVNSKFDDTLRSKRLKKRHPSRRKR